MSVCIVAQYPWRQIRHLRGLELPGVVVLSDTRLTTWGGQVLPWVAAKQGPLKRNVFACYTSSNVGVTLRALTSSVPRRDVKAIGTTLREMHERYGGATELVVVVWTRKLPPQILELMPPYYVPKRRTGVIGIGDRAVLTWFRDNLPDIHETERQQEFLEAIGERMPGVTFPEHRYGIDQASMQLVAGLYEAINRAGGQTVGLPVQLALVHMGEVRVQNVAMTADLKAWEEVAILPGQIRMPKLLPASTATDRYPRTAVQIFDA